MATYEKKRQETGEVAQAWPLHRVGLKVQNMAASLDYYTRLGFAIVRDESEQGTVGLGVGGKEIVSLRTIAGGRERPARTAGLYHFAILLPNEAELGSFLRHCIEQHIPIDGASDHLVSQALYLSDPEGNGIEVYADRPRDQWTWTPGGSGKASSIEMATLPLQADALLKQAGAFEGFSAQTVLGHMHLNVGNLDTSMAFYQKLGMDLTVGLFDSARFLSWEGYHHHLGINVWAGRNARRVEPDMYGIDFFELSHAGLTVGTFVDPDGVKVVVTEN